MEPITIKKEYSEEVSVDEKCAEIFRNARQGTFSFLCFACGEILDASGDGIFKHLGTHYPFEGKENAEKLVRIDETEIEADNTNPLVLYPLEEVNIDAQLPSISEECSIEGTSNAISKSYKIIIHSKK